MAPTAREVQALRRKMAAKARPTVAGSTVQAAAHVLEFALDPNFAGARLFPGQGTLLKVINLRSDLFTDFDHELVSRWQENYRLSSDEDGYLYTGTYGTPPDLLNRMTWCTNVGLEMFGELVEIIGRRGSKNFTTAIQLGWNVHRQLCRPNPQAHYELPPDKPIGYYILGANYDQVVRNAYRDIEAFFNSAPWFDPFRGAQAGRALTFLTQAQLAGGARVGRDQGLIHIVPAASTPTAVRGPAVVGLVLDETGHLERGTSAADSVDIYDSARAALAQFPDSQIIQISSPWLRTGQLFKSHVASLRVAPDGVTALHPEMLGIQLPSDALYEQAERSAEIEAWPGGPTYGEPMVPKITRAMIERELARDPDSATVEFLAQYGSVQNAYLRPGDVESIFAPYKGARLTHQTRGILAAHYVAHGDPARVNCNFGWAIAHVELDGDIPHVVFDLIHAWRPRDFPDRTINYNSVRSEIFGYVRDFGISELSFDPWNSAGEVDLLTEMAAAAHLPKPPRIYTTSTSQSDLWAMAETFKAAVQQGLVHAPHHDLAKAELEHLSSNGSRIDHPTTGPVQTKDTADAMIAVTYGLLNGMYKPLFDRLAGLPLHASQPSNSPPRTIKPERTVGELLSDLTGRIAVRSRSYNNPARGRRGRL